MSDNPVIETSPVNTPKRRYPAVLPLIVITAAVTLVIGIGLGLAQANIQPPDSGKVPDFSVTTFDGQPFRMSDQRGKVTVLNFWASWCDTCPAETPLLNALYSDYHDRGVSVIAITYLDNHSDSLAFMKQYAIRYPTAPDDGSRASAAFRIHQVPETYLI